MAFGWFTSYIGYPDFFASSGHSADLAKSFLRLAAAAHKGTTYSDAKNLFPNLDASQVETKKAAFQEFGLLYVQPRSDKLSVTPLGNQIVTLCSSGKSISSNRRLITVALVRALARYQFSNPLPVGGSKGKTRALSSDVRPYLVCYYLLQKLGGFITASEFFGAISALQLSGNVNLVVRQILKARKFAKKLTPHPGLPAKQRTTENLKIYFFAHLGLAGQILQTKRADKSVYPKGDQVFELTELGYEIVESVLDHEWPTWRKPSSKAPPATKYPSITIYFQKGVGQACPPALLIAASKAGEKTTATEGDGLVDPETLDSLKDLTHREYEEGKAKVVQHTRIERFRNPALVRDAKKAFKKVNEALRCEVCRFSFEKRYGERGRDFIEAHHRKPISHLDGTTPVKLQIKDLAMVCSNCHRMLHRKPWLTVEKLKKLLP